MTGGGGVLPPGSNPEGILEPGVPPKGVGWYGDHWTFAEVVVVAGVQGWEVLDLQVLLS